MKRYFIVVASILFCWGCEPKPNTSDLVKNMVVTTDYDNSVDFTKFTSYYLPIDTISYFNNSDSNAADTLQCAACSGNSRQLGDYAHLSTNEVINQMNLAGFTLVGKKQNPDLRVYIFIVENVNTYQSYYYNPYGYGFGYGFGYGYGYGYPVYTQTDQADLYLEIFDVKHLTNGKPTLVWYSDISDLVSSPDFSGLTVKAIDQAFKQSSYLMKQ
jgi:hypothetical protein